MTAATRASPTRSAPLPRPAARRSRLASATSRRPPTTAQHSPRSAARSPRPPPRSARRTSPCISPASRRSPTSSPPPPRCRRSRRSAGTAATDQRRQPSCCRPRRRSSRSEPRDPRARWWRSLRACATWDAALIRQITKQAHATPDAFALAAYDGFDVAVQTLLSTGTTVDGPTLRAAFTKAANGYAGVTGTIELDAAGDRASAPYAVLVHLPERSKWGALGSAPGPGRRQRATRRDPAASAADRATSTEDRHREHGGPESVPRRAESRAGCLGINALEPARPYDLAAAGLRIKGLAVDT